MFSIGGISQFVRRDHCINNAVLHGLVGLVLAAGGDPLHGVIHTDQARQAHGAAKARVQAQLHFRQAHLGLGAHHAEIGGQCHFQAATECDAVDGTHFRHVQVFKGVEHLVGFHAPAGDLVLRQLEHLGELGDVGADNKDALARGDDHALDVAVALQGFHSGAQVLHGFLVELVDGFALKIELQFGDAIIEQLDANGLAGIDHD